MGDFGTRKWPISGLFLHSSLLLVFFSTLHVISLSIKPMFFDKSIMMFEKFFYRFYRLNTSDQTSLKVQRASSTELEIR